MIVASAPTASTVHSSTATPSSAGKNHSPGDLGDLDTSKIFEQILAELDNDGDGKISDQEFAAYRASKAARGEYIATDPAGTGSNSNTTARDMTETIFQAAMEKES